MKTKTWSVRHRDGWCARVDGKTFEYDDNIQAACGYVIVMTTGIRRRGPTCKECRAVLKADARRGKGAKK